MGDVHLWRAQGPLGPALLRTAHGPVARASLLREADSLRRAPHPSLPRPLEVAGDGAWSAVDAAGEPLARWLPGADLGSRLDLTSRLAALVAHLHQNGLLLGPLPLDAVWVDRRGLPMLVVHQAPDAECGRADVAATVDLLPPEVADGDPFTPVGDAWCLGGLLYELLTGARPFPPVGPGALHASALSLPCPPSSADPRLPPSLDALALCLLAGAPHQRSLPMQLPPRLATALADPPGAALVGMERLRERLRRRVRLASAGHAEVVVLHGPPGSGRRALALEALQAARREGVKAVVGATTDRHLAGPACVALVDANRAGAIPLLREVLGGRLPALVLATSDTPLLELEALGARHEAVPPLEVGDVARLATLRPADGPPVDAEAVWTAAGGRPQAVLGALGLHTHGAWRLEHWRVLAAAGRPLRVERLARRLGLTETQLLDLADPMVAVGLLRESPDGTRLAARSRGPVVQLLGHLDPPAPDDAATEAGLAGAS